MERQNGKVTAVAGSGSGHWVWVFLRRTFQKAVKGALILLRFDESQAEGTGLGAEVLGR